MQTNRSAFITLISVFFFWGFVAASNDILIPVFKEKLNMTQGQVQLISFAFYIAYTVGSIIYVALSFLNKGDILNRLGYKNGIALGLVISAIGTLLFYPAAQFTSFGWMISGLFIVALGFSLQQTAANPMAIRMGDPSTGAQRLSLAGGINNIGTTIGPLLVSLAIFGPQQEGVAQTLNDISGVKTPYLILGLAFLIVAIIFKLSSLPNKIEEATDANASKESIYSSALKYPQLVLGMIAIFIYVGVEVATASNLPEYLKQHLSIPTSEAAPYVSLFWASLMIGRWASAAKAFKVSDQLSKWLPVIMPYLAFAVFLGVNKLTGKNLKPFYPYAGIILVMIIADYLSKGNPAKQLIIYSACGVLALIIGMLTNGLVSVYAFISVGLFCSTLWPCIFTLAISGLGKHTNQGSSFLIMMIMGGGFISYLQGKLGEDGLLGIKASYTVGVVCFVYLAFYGWKAAQILKKQGISLETK
jgi:MFS transporter, FHS family, L-fucose permease